MESKKINQLATELAPDLSDLTIIGDPTTGISKKITLSQMASLFTGTVEEYATLAAFPLVGVADTIYIALDTNVIYRYDTSLSAYVILSPNIINSLVFSDANGFDGTITLVGSVATLSITTALTTGSVGFIGASGALLQDNANLFWDDTNNRLGLNTNAPTTALDVFGSGIIGRINGTSTNNAFLGFASAGTNKWSIGNVQSDHRFRIYNEATTSELVSVLSTGEFGVGIANPTTKFHIDGAASALIANLDANVSVAKSISFRSDNSNRINLEVSGTESGSNAGADFFLRTFTDAGSLIETPFSIVRSTGVTTIKSLTLTNALSVANGGTGSATQNFVDLTTTQTIAGAKTFSAITSISNATASTSTTTGALKVTGGVGIGGALFGTSADFSAIVATGIITSQSNGSTFGNALATGRGIRIQGGSTGGCVHLFNAAGGDGTINALGTSTSMSYVFSTYSNGSAVTISDAGILGVGVTPSAWKSTTKALQIGASMSLLCDGTGVSSYFGSNLYVGADGNYKYIINGSAGLFGQEGNALVYYNATSGTAGNTASIVSRFEITADGYTRINTSVGSATLNLKAQSSGALIRCQNSANGDGTIYAYGTSTSVDYAFNTYSVGNAFYLYNNGNYDFAGSDVSDLRLKENINTIDYNATEKLMQLVPKSYNMIKHPDIKRSGFIAQEVQQVLPNFISGEETENDYLGIDYNGLLALAIKAIQELKAEIDILKAK